MYRSDGTQTGTSLVKDINADSSSGKILLFLIELIDIHTNSIVICIKGAGPGQSYPRLFVRVNSKNMLVFSGENGANGRELWVSDGTTAGTKLLADVNPGPESSDPQDLMMIG